MKHVKGINEMSETNVTINDMLELLNTKKNNILFQNIFGIQIAIEVKYNNSKSSKKELHFDITNQSKFNKIQLDATKIKNIKYMNDKFQYFRFKYLDNDISLTFLKQ